MPAAIASTSLAREVGIPATSRRVPSPMRAPIALMAYTAVLPVPRPTTIPGSTQDAANSPAACLRSS